MYDTMVVYYGNDLLPYKDKECQVHYPIVGNTFQGSSQTTKVKFYITNILRDDNSVWLAVTKLPNGQIGYTRVEKDVDENGTYLLLNLTRWHTQYKGDIYINLQCYDGGIEFEENDEDIYVPVGVPVIQVTGSIKIAINYATGIISEGDVDIQTLQDLIAYFANYLRVDSSKYIKTLFEGDHIEDINTEPYKKYIYAGDIVYSYVDMAFYIISGLYPSLSATKLSLNVNTLTANIITALGQLNVLSFSNIVANNESLSTYIANAVSGRVPQVDYETTLETLYETYGNDKLVLFFDGESSTINICHYVYDEESETFLVDLSNDLFYASYIDIEGSTGLDELKNTFTNAINYYDSAVSISGNSGSLTDDYVNRLKKQNSYIVKVSSVQRKIYQKTYQSGTNAVFQKIVDVTLSSGGRLGFVSEQVNVDLANKTFSVITSNNETYTKSQIDTLFSSALKYRGTKTVAQINGTAESGNINYDTIQVGDFYNVSDSGVIIGDIEVIAGDNICWTGTSWDKLTMDLSAYDDKFIAAGFFEVQNYNEDSGEITFVYASDLYDMSYDGDTGVLTIEAN